MENKFFMFFLLCVNGLNKKREKDNDTFKIKKHVSNAQFHKHIIRTLFFYKNLFCKSVSSG